MRNLGVAAAFLVLAASSAVAGPRSASDAMAAAAKAAKVQKKAILVLFGASW